MSETRHIPEFQPFGESTPDDAILDVVREGGDRPITSLAGDLDQEMRFGRQWLVLGRDALWVIPEPCEGNGVACYHHDETSEATVESCVGGGSLVVVRKSKDEGAAAGGAERTDGPRVEALFFTNSLMAAFSAFVVAINRYLKEGEVVLPGDVARHRCASCGRMLPEKNAPCPWCVRRVHTLRRLLSYGRRYLPGFVLVAVTTLLSTATQLAVPRN